MPGQPGGHRSGEPVREPPGSADHDRVGVAFRCDTAQFLCRSAVPRPRSPGPAPGRRPLDTDLPHCHLLGRPPRPAAGIKGPGRVGDWFSEGRYEPAPRVGVTRKCACGWNLPRRPLARQCRRASGAPELMLGALTLTGTRPQPRQPRSSSTGWPGAGPSAPPGPRWQPCSPAAPGRPGPGRVPAGSRRAAAVTVPGQPEHRPGGTVVPRARHGRFHPQAHHRVTPGQRPRS